MSRTIAVFASKNILRYPRLDTILMVEEAIKNAKDYPSKTQLWHSLPRKVMYQTFCLIIDYLSYSGKIHIENDGAIVWIFDPENVKNLLGKKHLVAR